MPNSPQPLLHYKGFLPDESSRRPEEIHERLDKNKWKTQWIFRYGPTQLSHYHSRVHETMVVLSGTATIRFGVADTDRDLDRNTWGGAAEEGGVEVEAVAGDVFVIPAGVAHKTYDTTPAAPFALISPGQGRGITVPDPAAALARVKLEGYTMMGAYPYNCGNWDFSMGGEDPGRFEESWNVAKPELDPFLVDSPDGLVGQWRASEIFERRNPVARL